MKDVIELQKNWYYEFKKLRDPGAHKIPLSFITSFLTQPEKGECDLLMQDALDILSNENGCSIEQIGNAFTKILETDEVGTSEP